MDGEKKKERDSERNVDAEEERGAKIRREGIYTPIRLKSCDLSVRDGGGRRGVGEEGRSGIHALIDRMEGKARHVGESVLVYCTRRPSPPATSKFNGGREIRNRGAEDFLRSPSPCDAN